MGTNLVISNNPRPGNVLEVFSKTGNAVAQACPPFRVTGDKHLEARPPPVGYTLYGRSPPLFDDRGDFLFPVAYAVAAYGGIEKNIGQKREKGTIISVYV